jgi:hypothetical protein
MQPIVALASNFTSMFHNDTDNSTAVNVTHSGRDPHSAPTSRLHSFDVRYGSRDHHPTPTSILYVILCILMIIICAIIVRVYL